MDNINCVYCKTKKCESCVIRLSGEDCQFLEGFVEGRKVDGIEIECPWCFEKKIVITIGDFGKEIKCDDCEGKFIPYVAFEMIENEEEN